MKETEQTGLTEENNPEETGSEGTTMDQRQQQIVDMGSSTITTQRGTIHTPVSYTHLTLPTICSV